METKKERLASIRHNGKRLCSKCFDKLSKEEKAGKEVKLNGDENCATACNECGGTCYYFHGANVEKFGING